MFWDDPLAMRGDDRACLAAMTMVIAGTFPRAVVPARSLKITKERCGDRARLVRVSRSDDTLED